MVFMISGISSHWKHPIAYFLQNKISTEVLTQLIHHCIGLLHAEGLNVIALVFDGSYDNQSTAVQLRCKMTVGDMQTWFPHPQVKGFKICVIFDVCYDKTDAQPPRGHESNSMC